MVVDRGVGAGAAGREGEVSSRKQSKMKSGRRGRLPVQGDFALEAVEPLHVVSQERARAGFAAMRLALGAGAVAVSPGGGV